jgi:DNA-binding transcriptional regulator YhcF (GntR family)
MTLVKGDNSSPIRLRLDPASGVPTYLQLVQQVERAVRLGFLQPGDQLPKVREVVAELAINPNTVLKAYRELEHRGLTSGRPGAGTFIQASLTPVDQSELAGLRHSLRRWLDEAAAAGLDEDGVAALVESTLRDFPERAAQTRGTQRRKSSGGGAA